jgi:hypothetical protein
MNITGIGNLINDRNNFTVFIKCQMDAGGPELQEILSNWTSDWTGFFFGRHPDSSGVIRWRVTHGWGPLPVLVEGSHVSTDVPVLMSFTSSGRDAEIFENGSLQVRKGSPLKSETNPSPPLNSIPPYVLGRQGIANGESFKGHLSELIVFDRCLPDAERAQVEACLGVTAPTPNANQPPKPPPVPVRTLRLPPPPPGAPGSK